MAADTAHKLVTYKDILDLPETLVGEIIHGALYTQPRPRPRHAMANTFLGSKLVSAFGDLGGSGHGPGGWVILVEPELHRDGNVLVPDIAGWRTENWVMPETAYFERAPDWVGEVLSPSTAQKDRVLKSQIYLDWGVSHMWLLDPEARYLEAFSASAKAAESAWTRIGAVKENDEVALAPFDAVPFKLGTLWPD
ncbi:MAG: Uma2 family endonuclease [Pseudomonadota bacterium]